MRHRTHVCPHCGHTCASAGGMNKHVGTCKKRPTKSELAAMRAKGMTQDEIAAACEVSDKAVRNWLWDYELEEPNERVRRPKAVKGVEYSPMFGVAGCPCEMESECRRLTGLGGWCACELPEREHLEWGLMTGLAQEYLVDG